MSLALLLSRFRHVRRRRILLERPVVTVRVLLDLGQHFGLENNAATTSMINFHPLINENQWVLPLAQIPPQTMTDYGFRRCLAMTDVPRASTDHIWSFWWLWACSLANGLSSVKRKGCHRWPVARHLSWRFLWSPTRLFFSVRSWTFWSLYLLSRSSSFTIRRTDRWLKLVSRAIFRIETLVYRYIRFLMNWRFLEMLTVSFLPLYGRRDS